MIASNRNRIIKSFHRKEYPLPKMYITREGEKTSNKSKISIIKEGECKIFSNQTPAILNEQSKKRKRRKKLYVPIKSGYFSNTTNSLQISIIGQDYLIGDEVLVLDQGSPYPFSVITNSKVTVYEITVDNLFSNLPKDIIHEIKRSCK